MTKFLPKFELIGSQTIRSITVEDCREPMVDLRVVRPHLLLDLHCPRVQQISKTKSFCRSAVAEMLATAQSKLPPTTNLLIKECFRPIEVQQQLFGRRMAKLRREYPLWSEERIYDECCQLTAPPDVGPHTTGGAVDLTLADHHGKELDLGTPINADPMATGHATHTGSQKIAGPAAVLRAILCRVMTDSGFVNYPAEWWHWSYGDKYWAYVTKQPRAVFGCVSLDEVHNFTHKDP